jgi:hypothetical protein
MFVNLFVKLTGLWFSRNFITKTNYPRLDIKQSRILHRMAKPILAIDVLTTHN